MKLALNPRSNQMLTAMKALVLVAAVWGVVFPTLLWSLKQLLPGT